MGKQRENEIKGAGGMEASASQSMCPAMPVPASAASPVSSLNSDDFPG